MALSQVTNLLNRAVTLATEVSNGTLNSSQQSAADQEYQSILSEVDNIGSTTTYNQQKVFGGADVGIYTGDSSTQGASIDSLHFASVARGTVGDAGGTVQYSTGQSVFLDLSSATANAQTTDNIAAGSSLAVNYENADGTAGQAVITPTTDTIGGLISAINSSGLGITANFTTAGAAGDAAPTGTAADTGIQISGSINNTGATATQMELVQGGTSVSDTSTSAGAIQAGSTGTATISYNDTTGTSQSLSGTNLRAREMQRRS